jgi:hypothetical protein
MSSACIDATPSLDQGSRIALVLPRHRLREWHRELLGYLGKVREVSVFLDDRAPPYPLAFRLWLRLEQLVLSDCGVARPIVPEKEWRPVSALGDTPGQAVINLSECPGPHLNALEIRYDGALDSRALLDRLLSLTSPYLTVQRAGGETPLAASRLAIEDKFSLLRGLRTAFARCISLVLRGIELAEAGDAVPAKEATVAPRGSLPAFASRMSAHKVSSALMKPFRHQDHWHVALRRGARTFKVVEDDGGRFYADPFLKTWQGRTFLFVEEYPYVTRRGIISAAEIVDDQLLAPPTPVLACPYHLFIPVRVRARRGRLHAAGDERKSLPGIVPRR